MVRNKLLFAVTIFATLILSCLGTNSSSQGQAVIRLDSSTTYQTITGWEATATIGQVYFHDQFHLWKDTVLDLAANDLGINRVRLAITIGTENPVDYFTQYLNGQISYKQFRQLRDEIINDNDDPFVIDPACFQFSSLDHTVDNVILPLKQHLEARGEDLYINFQYGGSTPSTAFRHSDHPDEYAEFILAAFQHLQSKYGWVPDAVEMANEPKHENGWSSIKIGNALVATAKRLQTNGFNPAFIAPSHANTLKAMMWFDGMIRVPGVLQYLSEFSYHRYGGASDPILQAIGDRAVWYGINTAQLEKFDGGGTYLALHKDLTLARVSAWQQYVIAYPTNKDNGAHYYRIDISDANNPRVKIGSRTRFLRQYFKFIRRGAVRIEATTKNNNFDPLGFINTDGKYVVVVKANRGGSFTIQGLPAGTYGIKYTTSRQYDVDAPDVTISSGQALNASIPEKGVVTVYAK